MPEELDNSQVRAQLLVGNMALISCEPVCNNSEQRRAFARGLASEILGAFGDQSLAAQRGKPRECCILEGLRQAALST